MRFVKNASAGLGLASALGAVVVVGVALTAVFYTASQAAAERRAFEAADLLARDALTTFASAGTERLAELPVGGDSIMATTRVQTGTELTGAAIVLVRRADEMTYHIKSTGRLDTARGPVICSVDVALSAGDTRHLDLPRVLRAVCNGEAREVHDTDAERGLEEAAAGSASGNTIGTSETHGTLR